jgi:ABC-type multidrug transport system ATPase subunit
MSEKILRALMQLFAIVANGERLTAQSRHIVETFLKQQLNQAQVEKYLEVFDEFLSTQQGKGDADKIRKRTSVNSVKVLKICTDINHELNQRQKYVVLIRLIEFIHSSDETISEQEWEFINTVSSIFNIPERDYKDCLAIAGTSRTIPDADSFLLIDSKTTSALQQTYHLFYEDLNGYLLVFFIKSVGISFVKYSGDSPITINGQSVNSDFVQVFTQGSVIRGTKMEPVYYSDVVHRFLQKESESKIKFEVRKVEYKFKNGKTGLHPISFQARSGELIGIMGGSGAGKSTLLNVLNGNLIPSEGEVLINEVNQHTEGKKLEGVIGYIPQDDLLMDDLTVFQNVYYNTKLCYGDLDEGALTKKVLDLLESLGLSETKDLKVGNSLDKTISGGQRKRLNIALELVREPSVLFVDEPTSGLSSRDSENVMDLLKQLSISGKLIFVVIHQPSSDIFKLFDKLFLLDNGGYPIYYGNPVDSLIYFKKMVEHVNAEESECITCGNINPEQLFSIIEAKVLDEFGNPVNARKISPAEWNKLYLKNFNNLSPAESKEQNELNRTSVKPSVIRQFGVFITRDLLSKLSNKQYLLINFLEAPILAFVLSYLIRYYQEGKNYVFRENQNIPAFIFMSVIVAIFLGLSVSAEEIFRDRKILKRESFLHLSRTSYLLSKISVMFLLSAIQTFLFVMIGNSILGIKEMYIDYWLVLFSAACFANMTGLNISSAFNSAVTIYILIPILIIPQILLSGIIVKFEKLNPTISTHSTVPFFGEIMASRWAFEGLAVNQFKNNEYERRFFEYDKQMSHAIFKKDFLLPELMKRTDYSIFAMTQSEKRYMLESNLRLLTNEIKNEAEEIPSHIFPQVSSLKVSSFNESIGQAAKAYLNDLTKFYIDEYNKANAKKETLISHIQESDPKILHRLKDDYSNESLEELLKNTTEQKQIEEANGRLIQRFQPVFMEGSPTSFISAPFFASRKNIVGTKYETYWVNILVIWFMTIFAAIALYFDWLKKLVGFGEKFSFKFKKQG